MGEIRSEYLISKQSNCVELKARLISNKIS